MAEITDAQLDAAVKILLADVIRRAVDTNTSHTPEDLADVLIKKFTITVRLNDDEPRKRKRLLPEPD
jgi:hypothetical protein